MYTDGSGCEVRRSQVPATKVQMELLLPMCPYHHQRSVNTVNVIQTRSLYSRLLRTLLSPLWTELGCGLHRTIFVGKVVGNLDS
jgi:hypothetical protein